MSAKSLLTATFFQLTLDVVWGHLREAGVSGNPLEESVPLASQLSGLVGTNLRNAHGNGDLSGISSIRRHLRELLTHE